MGIRGSVRKEFSMRSVWLLFATLLVSLILYVHRWEWRS